MQHVPQSTNHKKQNGGVYTIYLNTPLNIAKALNKNQTIK